MYKSAWKYLDFSFYMEWFPDKRRCSIINGAVKFNLI